MRMHPNLVEITEPSPHRKCGFCHSEKINKLLFGPMYHLNGVTTHHFCLLFSSNGVQAGTDAQGILGFLIPDIKNEMKRGDELKCYFCDRTGATVKCCEPSCSAAYHYTCSLDQGVLYHFAYQFQSFCVFHRPPSFSGTRRRLSCPICFEPVEENFLFLPDCCKSYEAIGHRKCIMEAALHSGFYHLKCPNCRDNKEYINSLMLNGIYVPIKDAAWELEPDAYSELKLSYSVCDATPCLCPSGRKFVEKRGDWALLRCGACAAAAVHVGCGNLTKFTFRCETCVKVLNETEIIGNDDDDTEVIDPHHEMTDDDIGDNSYSIVAHHDSTNLIYDLDLDSMILENDDDYTTSDLNVDARSVQEQNEGRNRDCNDDDPDWICSATTSSQQEQPDNKATSNDDPSTKVTPTSQQWIDIDDDIEMKVVNFVPPPPRSPPLNFTRVPLSSALQRLLNDTSSSPGFQQTRLPEFPILPRDPNNLVRAPKPLNFDPDELITLD
ncbi:PHD finger protein 7 isoform X2 [Folsomia candida]|uniref:G2/M phase-specific E3 ubiquitin-protein ligase n=1 Tax=Folsomia candida TaxID=158441 RepID=A0A226F6D0_FOLCA|nr:PHD finger protein 7 isoform X2 [Folsomia candida]OXA64761.1 G2/M phase-specific E3 ubiquitin-protein ligase [Folsomia candida]